LGYGSVTSVVIDILVDLGLQRHLEEKLPNELLNASQVKQKSESNSIE
jgi:hypothetical protein